MLGWSLHWHGLLMERFPSVLKALLAAVLADPHSEMAVLGLLALLLTQGSQGHWLLLVGLAWKKFAVAAW